MVLSLSGQRTIQILSFLIPAYSTAELSFKASLMAISPADISAINTIIKSSLTEAQLKLYEAMGQSEKVGGLSLLGLWATESNPLQAMNKIGLSPASQKSILQKLTQITTARNDFHYKTSVDNSASDKDTTGELRVVTVKVHAANPTTGKTVTHTIIAPDVKASTPMNAGLAQPSIIANPLYSV